MCVHARSSADAHRVQKRMSEFLELELQEDERSLILFCRAKLGSSARTVHALNCSAEPSLPAPRLAVVQKKQSKKYMYFTNFFFLIPDF